MMEFVYKEPNFYNVVFYPSSTWKSLLGRRNFFKTVVLYFFCQFSQLIGLSIFHREVFLMLPLFFVNWILTVAIYHFTARAVGGGGDILSLFYLWAFTEIPLLFSPPAIIFIKMVGGGIVLLFLFFVCIYLWSFVLKIKAVQQVYYLSSLVAFMVLVFPPLILSFLTALSFLIYGVSFILW